MRGQGENITGVILSGGKSSRMGRDKAILDLHGIPFIQHISDTLRETLESVIIISDHRERYEFLGLPIYPDIRSDCGPLGGIHSAIVNAKSAAVLVLSCDMPLVSSEIVRYLILHDEEGADAVVPRVLGTVHPLCGIYKSRCLVPVENHLLHGNWSVTCLLKDVKTKIVPLTYSLSFYSPFLLMDVNTPEEYDMLRLGEHSSVGH